MNIWDLGSWWLNLKAVMGDRLIDWFVPFRRSPCCDHGSPVSQFPLGPDFKLLLEEVGLVDDWDAECECCRLGCCGSAVEKLDDGNVEAGGSIHQHTKKHHQPLSERKRKEHRAWKRGQKPEGLIARIDASNRRREEKYAQRRQERRNKGESWC